MPQTHTKIYIHCVFSTKNRQRNISSDIKNRLYDYITGIGRKNKIETKAIGGIDDHVHILMLLSPAMPASKAVQLIKGGSSKWMNDIIKSGKFEWQEGYGAFSIGISQVGATIKYIKNQEEHHKKHSFKEEFISFLVKNNIEYDERYVF